MCAQRLTASEVWALNKHLLLINGGLVLNALRHQRFGHNGNWFNYSENIPSSAQRLTASEVWAQGMV